MKHGDKDKDMESGQGGQGGQQGGNR
jgi:hypothetical protein